MPPLSQSFYPTVTGGAPNAPRYQSAIPGGYGGGGGGFNYASDPGLQQFLAFYNRERQGAGARRDESRRRRLIQLGSRDVARRILGDSDPILASISDDPNATSDFARVLKQYQDNLKGVDESTSASNTFWGTGRATGYQGAAYQRQQTEADYIKAAEADIQGYQDMYDQFLRELETQKYQVEQEAWMRQMWGNLLNGGAGTAGGYGGIRSLFGSNGAYIGGPSGGTQGGLARPIANPGTQGQNMRYDITGLQYDPATGLYTDGTYHYDSNGLSTDRPDVPVPGLNPANNN